MKVTIIFIFSTFFLLKGNSQIEKLSICEESSTFQRIYDPAIETFYDYPILNESMRLEFVDSLKNSGITFYKTRIGSIGDIRIIGEKEGSIYFYDSAKDKIVCLIPKDKIPNHRVEAYKLQFDILSYDESLVTPYCHYEGLIKIRTISWYDDRYVEAVEYYKRNIGMIALEIEGKLYAYLSQRIKNY